MKRMLLVVVLLFAVTSAAVAEEADVEGPRYTIFTKLGRGIGNLIKAPIEIPVTLFNVSAETDVVIGIPLGLLAGSVAGCERVIAGVIDLGTFIFPPYDRPLITYELGKSAAAKAASEAFPSEF